MANQVPGNLVLTSVPAGGGVNSDAAYDGLHPNALGDYQLAQAFSRTLISAYSVGRTPLVIPEHIPPRPLPTPTKFQATSAPSGIIITWDAVYGALGYDLQRRHAGDHDWALTRTDSNRVDWQGLREGQVVECRVRTSGGDYLKSPWSRAALAVAHPQTAPPPINMITHATSTGFTIAWDSPSPPFAGEIDRFAVTYFDGDEPGAFPCQVGVRGNRAELTGLASGHRHHITMATWTTVGGGVPAAARAVTVGRGTPPTPTSVCATALDSQTVELGWPEVVGAAGYEIWIQSSRARLGLLAKLYPLRHPIVRDDGSKTVKATLFNMLPSAWDWEYAVRAYNGHDPSGLSAWVTPPSLAPNTISFTKGDSIHVDIKLG